MKLGDDRKLGTLIFNPFLYVAGARALFIGIAAILLAGWIGSWGNTHFDGVLDAHSGAPAPLWLFPSEGMIDWFCLGIVLLIAGRMISKTPFRTIDVLGTQAMARWPAVLLGLIALPPAVRRFGNYLLDQLLKPESKAELNVADAIIFSAVVAATIVVLCWMVALMYRAYSVSCNVKGGRAIGTFIAGILVAEILSKTALYWLLKLI